MSFLTFSAPDVDLTSVAGDRLIDHDTSPLQNVGNPGIELNSRLYKDKEGTPLVNFAGDVITRTVQTPDDVAFILGLPSAFAAAHKHGSRIPPPPTPTDKSQPGKDGGEPNQTLL